MGITTPFPEPESPELQRFTVQSPEEVSGLLHALHRRAVPLNIFAEPGSDFDVAALLEVDDEGGELRFGGLGRHPVHEWLTDASRLTFTGFVDAVKLQFRASSPRASAPGSRHAFAVPMPTQLLRLQRRGGARIRPRAADGLLCCVGRDSGAGNASALRVLDLSSGGLSLLVDAAGPCPAVGSRLGGCRIQLPGVGSIEADLWVRHAARLPGQETAVCIGCEFDALTPSARALLDAYLRQFAATAGRRPGPVQGDAAREALARTRWEARDGMRSAGWR
jgi:c-di-GMP-binding flagellar brake protein YcgR